VPFVRFSRDRRGYEHVYLIDTKDRGRTRLLYWFRTPPGVRVGRNPFDLDTQRSLERQNPGVQFDWPQIVAAKMPPPAPVESWREKRRAERAFKRARAAEVESPQPDSIASAETEAAPLELDEAEPFNEGEASDPEALVELVEADPERVGLRDTAEADPEGDGPAVSAERGAQNSQAPARRGRRRRRRRGRRPADRTAPAAPIAAGENGPLDPKEPSGSGSKEE
jgi:hypothetical protein